jgi:hypothetical protein
VGFDSRVSNHKGAMMTIRELVYFIHTLMLPFQSGFLGAYGDGFCQACNEIIGHLENIEREEAEKNASFFETANAPAQV